MRDPDIFTMYDKFGNLFGLTIEQGKLYELERIPSPEEKAKTVYIDGKYLTYEVKEGCQPIEPTLPMLLSVVTKQFALKLRAAGYRFRGRHLPYRSADELDQPCKDVFRIYDGFEFRIVNLSGSILLCINPHLILRSNCTVGQLVKDGVDLAELADFSTSYRGAEGKRIDGYLIETKVADSGQALCKVKSYREFKQEDVPAEDVLPEPKPEVIQRIIEAMNRRFNVIAFQRKYSFLDSSTASRDRLVRTLEIVKRLQEEKIFPLTFGGFQVNLDGDPVVIQV